VVVVVVEEEEQEEEQEEQGVGVCRIFRLIIIFWFHINRNRRVMIRAVSWEE
jgi:hypothetical protein